MALPGLLGVVAAVAAEELVAGGSLDDAQGVSGQAKMSVNGGWALWPACRRWAGDATTIGLVMTGVQSGVGTAAAVESEESWQ